MILFSYTSSNFLVHTISLFIFSVWMLDICPRFYCIDVSSVCIVIYWGSLWEEITSSLKNSLTITSWVLEPRICLRGRLGLDSNPSFTISWLCFLLATRCGVICASTGHPPRCDLSSHRPPTMVWSVLLSGRPPRCDLSSQWPAAAVWSSVT